MLSEILSQIFDLGLGFGFMKCTQLCLKKATKYSLSKPDNNKVKPIFHQNAKYLASGTFASPDAKDRSFASPNARNTNMLVSLALGDANFLRRPCTFHFFV